MDLLFKHMLLSLFFKGLKSLFANLPLIGRAFRDNLEPTPSPPKSRPKSKENEDNNNDTP